MEVSSIATAALLLSCSQVQIKDEIFYGNKGVMGAVEFHSFTTDTREISFEEWMKLIREKPLICESVDTFGDIKVALEQLCSLNSGDCTADTKAKLEEFFKNVQNARAKVEAKK